jgi:hypothetical protein
MVEVSGKNPCVEMISRTVSKVFTLSTGGKISLPMLVVSSFVQLHPNSKQKVIAVMAMGRIRFCTIIIL